MQRLCSLLGMPQHRFASVHVVGTNGKSSVVRMLAALLEAHGVRTGSYLSPHLFRWSERVRVGDAEIDPGEFAAAVERARQAAEVVNRSLEQEGDAVTQFELSTAAAFVALAAARVQAGVIEAGLGGRLDATNVIPSRVTVLTSIGLEHTEWLGETELEIAAEKLAVLRHHSTLVLGRVGADVAELAERTAAEHGARLVRAPEDPGEGIALAAPGRFQRRNFALAATVAEVFLGETDPAVVREVAAGLVVPGRLQLVDSDPPTFFDAAHNADGAAALAEALPQVCEGPLVGCVALLADKDAGAFMRALGPALDRVVCTELPDAALQASGRPGARTAPAADLVSLCAGLGLPAEAERQPGKALGRARRLAAAGSGAAIATGSHYLLGELWTRRHAQSSSR
jgi:dihydrofolate synthase / folylpolyglutamate synthase